MRLSITAIAIVLLTRGCEGPNDPLPEIFRAYQPMFCVGIELTKAHNNGEALPDSMEALETWAKGRANLQTPEAKAKVETFVRRGLFLTNIRDKKGTLHDYLLVYHVTTRGGPGHEWVCTFDSSSGWGPINYMEDEARTLFGNEMVDQSIARGKEVAQEPAGR